MNILITICARGGSKGVPQKNIRKICGKPLIAYTIAFAKKISYKLNANIALSTDDYTIKNIAKELGLNTNYLRPDFLSTDSAGKIDTIKDLLLFEELNLSSEFDYILDLDVTSPLRTIDDVLEGFEKLKNNFEAQTLFSVSPSSRNPYFNMVEESNDGFYRLVKKIPKGSILSRQSAPVVYDLNASFYWYKRSFFNSNIKTPITEKSLVFLMKHVCFDIDDPIDFLFIEFLIENNKLNFEI